MSPAHGGESGRLPASIKRSVTLHGHRTSLALEPEFWSALDAAAAAEGLPLATLIAMIDDDRTARPGRSLASAIRVYLLERAAPSAPRL